MCEAAQKWVANFKTGEGKCWKMQIFPQDHSQIGTQGLLKNPVEIVWVAYRTTAQGIHDGCCGRSITSFHERDLGCQDQKSNHSHNCQDSNEGKHSLKKIPPVPPVKDCKIN